jgi:Cu/Ag efflux protein CusF
MYLTKWTSATMVIALMAGTAAADAVADGKVKSINAEGKTFVLTDAKDKDFTFHLSDKLVVNRGGKESKSDLKAGDVVSVRYDQGLIHWTTNYILVIDASSKNCEMMYVTVKNYDAAKKEITFTNQDKKDSTFAMGNATVRFSMVDGTIDNVKIGDHALIIVDTVAGKATLQSVMVDRAAK